jgi:hypothetical protein
MRQPITSNNRMIATAATRRSGLGLARVVSSDLECRRDDRTLG